MKKLLIAIITVVLIGGLSQVKAMTTDDLAEKLGGTYNIGGKSVKLDDAINVRVKRYLSEYGSTLDDEQLQVINEQIDDFVAYLGQNPNEIDNPTAATRKKLEDALQAISDNTTVRAALTEDGIEVYVPGSNEVFDTIGENDVEIRKTGNDYILVAVASVISVIGIAAITKKVAGLNA